MNKKELVTILDNRMLDKLFGFCYSRTNNHYEAEDLSSDIILEILKQSKIDGEIGSPESYIWRIARNVYAKYSEKRRIDREHSYEGNPEDVLANVPDEEYDENEEDKLKKIFRSISFLSSSYRDIMISFYFEGKSTAQIANEYKIKETTVRQRLFSARNTIRNEVEKMDTIQKPTLLSHINYEIWGTGDPTCGDPRTICEREISKHIMHLCSQRPYTAKELSENLNVPMIYIEDEVNILKKGQYGRYGVLKEIQEGKFAMNFVLLTKEQTEKAWNIYKKNIPLICDAVIKFVKENEKEYLSLPYINKNVTMNAILWQQIRNLGYTFNRNVKKILSEKYFSDVSVPNREFSVYGYENFGKIWGGGCDGIYAKNIQGYSSVIIQNIYSYSPEFPIEAHFHCSKNISNDSKLLMAIRCIYGLDVNTLSVDEKEIAAKAVQEDYIYRDGDILYTKFLVMEQKDEDLPDNISNRIGEQFAEQADKTAKEMAAFIKAVLPKHLIGEYKYVADLASMPILETLILSLIERKILKPLENSLNAETVFMTVKK